MNSDHGPKAVQVSVTEVRQVVMISPRTLTFAPFTFHLASSSDFLTLAAVVSPQPSNVIRSRGTYLHSIQDEKKIGVFLAS